MFERSGVPSGQASARPSGISCPVAEFDLHPGRRGADASVREIIVEEELRLFGNSVITMHGAEVVPCVDALPGHAAPGRCD